MLICYGDERRLRQLHRLQKVKNHCGQMVYGYTMSRKFILLLFILETKAKGELSLVKFEYRTTVLMRRLISEIPGNSF